MTRPPARVPARLSIALAGLLACLAAGAPAAAQPTPLPGVGNVEQGVEWRAFLDPTPLAAGESIVFVARGTVGARHDREIGRLLIAGTADGLVAGADFRALGGEGLRIALLDGNQPVAEVPAAADLDVVVPEDPIETGPASAASLRRAPAGEEAVPGTVHLDLGSFPAGAAGSVTVALFHRAGFASASGEVVPAPAFALDLGARTEVTLAGETYLADTVLFLARTTFPPPGSPSAILERVEVYTDVPAFVVEAEAVEPGVVFSGVPVTPNEGTVEPHLDRGRNAIAAVDLPGDPVVLLTGEAAGAAVAWEAADLAAGAVGSFVDLGAIGQNLRGVEVRGVVVATRTADGWDLSFQPPGGLAETPLAVTVDGEAVGEVVVPLAPSSPPEAIFARSAQPPSGAVVMPSGLGGGAGFYGFSWDDPVAIAVPGAGTFTGRQVRVELPSAVGPLAFAGIATGGLDELTLTGVAAPGLEAGGLCLPTPTTLCLTGDRFAVRAVWADPFGASGPGIPHPLTADTGAFWFFEPSNLELMVKALDACPVNDRFWVFAGGLTDVAVELTVTDTRTGAERVYENPQGQDFLPVLDTAAFATCAP
jgi:hypothetical protein